MSTGALVWSSWLRSVFNLQRQPVRRYSPRTSQSMIIKILCVFSSCILHRLVTLAITDNILKNYERKAYFKTFNKMVNLTRIMGQWQVISKFMRQCPPIFLGCWYDSIKLMYQKRQLNLMANAETKKRTTFGVPNPSTLLSSPKAMRGIYWNSNQSVPY